MKLSQLLSKFDIPDTGVCLHPVEEEILSRNNIVNDMNIPSLNMISTLNELASVTNGEIDLKSNLIEVKYIRSDESSQHHIAEQEFS